jgi:hypothetical protein
VLQWLDGCFVHRYGVDRLLDLGADGRVGLFKHLVRAHQFEPHHETAFLNAVAESHRNAERITAEERFNADVELLRNLELSGLAGLSVDLLVVGQLNLAVIEARALAKADVLLG